MKAPTIAYPGAKGRLAPILVSMMPQQGRIYLEPFAGRGNVYFAASSSNLRYVSWELNDMFTAPFFWALVKTEGCIPVPKRTKSEYLRQKRLFQKGDLRAILLESYLTFSGGGYKNGGFGSLHGATAVGYAKTLRRCADLLIQSRAKVTSKDWKRLNLSSLTDQDFVFFDPPYYGADVRAYSNHFDFTGMVETLKKAKFKWMLTEYRQDFYVKAFGEPCYTKPVQLACDGRGSRSRVECVWKNY